MVYGMSTINHVEYQYLNGFSLSLHKYTVYVIEVIIFYDM